MVLNFYGEPIVEWFTKKNSENGIERVPTNTDERTRVLMTLYASNGPP